MASNVDLSTIPAAVAPPGLVSNFLDPPTLVGAVATSIVIVQLVTLVFILIRLYDNVWSRRFRLEDYLSYLAWIFFILQTALIGVNSTHGMARHIWDIPVSTIIEGSRRYNTIFLCYTISGGFAKATIFLQFKRIFTPPPIRGPVYWAITISLTVNALAYTAFLFLYIFTCWPREKIWNRTVPGRCMDSNKLNLAIGVLNLLSDVEAFLVPSWALWRMRMEVRKKVSVFLVFAVGALAVTIGGLGLYYRVLIIEGSDKTWLLTQTALICMAELGIVIVVGCCPCIPRVINRHRQRRVGTPRDSDGVTTIGSSGKKRPRRLLGWSLSGNGTSAGDTLHSRSDQCANGSEFITRADVVSEVKV